jgi:hypothetical protein
VGIVDTGQIATEARTSQYGMRARRAMDGGRPVSDLGRMQLILSQRFVTLHRNGSASINRIYARNFDPYEIYDELKSVIVLDCDIRV